MTRHKIHIGQTIATLLCQERFIPRAEAAVRRVRKEIEDYIGRDPRFRTALEPRGLCPDAPPVVKRMAAAARRVKVGPMAAVAGAVAEYTVRALQHAGARHVVFDNGGDIAFLLEKPVVVGIYAGPTSLQGFGFRVSPRDGIFGICTSSASVGHSLSLGVSDASIVVARDVLLADAAATALGNRIISRDRNHFETVFAGFQPAGVQGMMAVAGETAGMWGDLPELCRADVEYDLITRG
jgi:ApbE superfamily uncharacterized protein (UPF0280 family)